mgnify:FL=1
MILRERDRREREREREWIGGPNVEIKHKFLRIIKITPFPILSRNNKKGSDKDIDDDEDKHKINRI